MSENITIELSPEQREYLLAGLRYVRSSIALEIVDWTPEVEEQRDQKYALLDNLESMLNGVSPAETHAKV